MTQEMEGKILQTYGLERERRAEQIRLEIGEKIRRARKRRGWTQSKLAELTGVGIKTISFVENGASTHSVTISLLLAELWLSVEIKEADQ